MDVCQTREHAEIRRLQHVKFAVIDVETTGIDAAVDRVVEVACALMQGGRRLETFSTLVNPGRPIPATASAIHHITDRHVRDAPPLSTLRQRISAFCSDAIVVAHNAAFDLRFLPFLSGRPMLCSMRLARYVLPTAPNYKNQVLRYYLGIDEGLPENALAHRAPGDVEVTSRILSVCLQRYLSQGGPDDADELIRRIGAPLCLRALPSGRHRGVGIAAVPTDYLQWLCAESRSATLDARFTAECELRRRAIGAR